MIKVKKYINLYVIHLLLLFANNNPTIKKYYSNSNSITTYTEIKPIILEELENKLNLNNLDDITYNYF